MEKKYFLYFSVGFIITSFNLALADLDHFVKAGCESVQGWSVVQKLSEMEYVVEFSTSRYAGNNCIRDSGIPGGCIAAGVLSTSRIFLSTGRIAEEINVTKKGKMPLKSNDSFSKDFQVYIENKECDALLVKVDSKRASRDPKYSCDYGNVAEDCFKVGVTKLKDTIPGTASRYFPKKYLEKACEKQHKKACIALKKAKAEDE